MNGKYYNVNGIGKPGTALTYADVKLLYDQFYEKYGKYPTTKYQTLKYNVPHSKIVAKVLDEAGITLNDFQNTYGVVAHVRSDPKHYNLYVDRFKQLCKSQGVLTSDELLNNNYGLPNPSFFAKYCPDDSVQSYDDFIRWCGFTTRKRTKEEVVQALLDYQQKLGRPLINRDIRPDTVGFSMIVINRIWGTMSACKEELNLLPTTYTKELYTLEKYKQRLDARLNEIKDKYGHNIVTWKDLEAHDGFITEPVDHHSIYRKFNKYGESYTDYIESKGFRFNTNSYGHITYLQDDECCRSKAEVEFSTVLQSWGFVFNQTYFRDVMYKTFCTNYQGPNRANCDYVVVHNGIRHYIELAGSLEWAWDLTKELTDEYDIEYRKRLLEKIELLKQANVPYLILYNKDLSAFNYHDKVKQFLGMSE